MRACVCQDGNQVSKCCIHFTTTEHITYIICITIIKQNQISIFWWTRNLFGADFKCLWCSDHSPIMMSAGELESGNAGEPAKLIRQRYREAADIIKKGKMCCLFINDLDAGAGRLGGTTQYTVNNQMVNATLMNIADNPTNVQLPGMYNKEENPRVPIIVTGNDFSTLYAPLIRDGRMEKFYWAPTRDDRIGVCKGIFLTDNVPDDDIVKLVDTFPGQSIGK